MLHELKEEKYNTFVKAFFHFVFWALVIDFTFDFIGIYRSFKHLFIARDTNIIDEAFIFLPLAIAFFYWNYTYLTAKYLNEGKWGKYCIGLFLSILFIYFLSDGLYHFFKKTGYDFNLPNHRFLDHGIGFYTQSFLASTSLGVAKTAMNNLSKKREAEEKQKEAELKYLANQFNPHFLHNTLNGIYSKAIEENAPETTEAIVRLSEIMRYPINQGLKSQVSLIEEVQFIEDYIDLQRLRLGKDYPIYFEKEKNLDGINILPLSLIILVENSFKYGVSQKNKTPISFQLKLERSYLHFITENHFKNKENISSHNIGLQNLKSRLQLLYKEKYNLKTEVKEDKYVVVLKLGIN